MADSKPKVYAAWFCPFANRAWVAMMAKKVDFEYIETDPANKTPEWMAISPTGQVPVIVNGGKTVYESAVCVEYIDEAFSTGVSLMPTDPYKRAVARIWADFLGKKVLAHYANVFMKRAKVQGEQKDEELEKFQDALKKFLDAMDPNTKYFQGDTIGYLDILLTPFANLLRVFNHFTGYEVPSEFKRFHEWWDVVKIHPAVKPISEITLDTYLKYYENFF